MKIDRPIAPQTAQRAIGIATAERGGKGAERDFSGVNPYFQHVQRWVA